MSISYYEEKTRVTDRSVLMSTCVHVFVGYEY